MSKGSVTLRDALKQGFSQVMGLPGVAYYRKGRHYNNALQEVNLDGSLVEQTPAADAAPEAPAATGFFIGELDGDAIAFEHNGESFSNFGLAKIAYEQSGMTRAEWNAQSPAQVAARVLELVDDMKAAVAADADGQADAPAGDPPTDDGGEPVVDEAAIKAKAEEQAKLAELRKAMDDADAALKAVDPADKKAITNAKRAYTTAKNAFEKAAGLSG